MNISKKQDLSIVYWLKDHVPSSVHVVDGFPTTSLELPTTSVTALDMRGSPFELGGKELVRQLWRIDVFGANINQRDLMASTIFEELENNIPVYDYDFGFPPPVPPRIGTLIVTERRLTPVHVFEDLVEKLYYRTSITFFTYYQPS